MKRHIPRHQAQGPFLLPRPTDFRCWLPRVRSAQQAQFLGAPAPGYVERGRGTSPTPRDPDFPGPQDPHPGPQVPGTGDFPQESRENPLGENARLWTAGETELAPTPVSGEGSRSAPLRLFASASAGTPGAPLPPPYLAPRTESSRPRRSAPLPGYPGPCRWTSGPGTGPASRSWRAGRR